MKKSWIIFTGIVLILILVLFFYFQYGSEQEEDLLVLPSINEDFNEKLDNQCGWCRFEDNVIDPEKGIIKNGSIYYASTKCGGKHFFNIEIVDDDKYIYYMFIGTQKYLLDKGIYYYQQGDPYGAVLTLNKSNVFYNYNYDVECFERLLNES